MSNAYTHINNYSDVLFDTPAFELIQTGLQFKQQKYDAGKAKLESLVSKIGTIDLAKTQDKEYLQKRLQTTLDIANKYASGDLSDDNLVNSLKMTIGQVADDNVMNAVASTKIMRAEQKEWEDARKKADGKYSDVNRAWASQNAQKWLSDGQVGSTYNGGGGFIEYRDLSKKLTDNIGKIQDALKAKWVQVGPGQGYFQSLDTYEAVDKGKMNQALESLFDAADAKQMQINSWATYGNATVDQMKMDWESINSPELEYAKKRIDALTVLKNKPEEKGNIERYDEEIKIHKSTVEAIQNNSFENVVKTYGKDGAAQILYKTKLKDNILDSYSYEPRLVDRKIDEVQAESVKFQQKVNEFNQDMELKKATLLLDTEKFKAEQAASGMVEGTSTGTNVSKSEPITLETGTGKTAVQEHLNIISNAWKGVESLGVTRGKIDKNDFVKLSTQLSDLEGKAKRGETINIGGKEIKVTLDNIVKLRNFKDNVLNTSKAEKEIHSRIDEMLYGGVDGGVGIQTSLERLAEAKVKGRAYDFDVAELPRFSWVLESDGKGGFRKAQAKTSNPYATLLMMKGKGVKLTDAQEKTLQAYTATYALTDNGLDIPDDIKTEMFRNLKYNTLSGMSSKEFSETIGNSVQTIKTTVKGTRDYVKLSNFESKGKVLDDLKSAGVDVKYMTTGQAIPQNIAPQTDALMNLYALSSAGKISPKEFNDRKNNIMLNIKKLAPTEATPLSEISAADNEYINKYGKEVSLPGVKDIVKSGINLINSTSGMDLLYKEMSYQNPILRPGSSQYTSIKNLAVQKGLVGEDYKGPLEVERFREGDMSGSNIVIKASLKNSEKDGGGFKITSSQPVDYNDFLKTTGFEIAKPKRPTYDATKGKYANNIDLGNGAGIEDTGAFGQSLNSFTTFAKQVGSVQMGNIIDNYFKGNYTFSIDAINNQYFRTIKDEKGKVVFKVETGEVTFDDEDYKHMVQSSDDIISDVMTMWLNQEQVKAQRLAEVRAIQEQNKQIYNK